MPVGPKHRHGLRIVTARGNSVVGRALIRYAKWLRTKIAFPHRVPVYLLAEDFVRSRNGGNVSATCFIPYDRNEEPYIRIATGDYSKIRAARGRDNALAGYLEALSHEVIHYRQWVETNDTWERGVTKQAGAMVDEYAKTVDRP